MCGGLQQTFVDFEYHVPLAARLCFGQAEIWQNWHNAVDKRLLRKPPRSPGMTGHKVK